MGPRQLEFPPLRQFVPHGRSVTGGLDELLRDYEFPKLVRIPNTIKDAGQSGFYPQSQFFVAVFNRVH